MIHRSERGIFTDPETRSIRSLTKKDMEEIAKATNGRCVDNSLVYWQVAEILWKTGEDEVASLILCKGETGRGNPILKFKRFGKIEILPTPFDTITFAEDGVTIETSKTASSVSKLTIGKNQIIYAAKCEMPINPGSNLKH